MKAKQTFFALVLGLVAPLALAGGCNKCKPDEAPPPLPTPEAATNTTPETSLEAEDAGEDVEDAGDADADAAKKLGVGVPSSNLKKCCAALAQNAASTPPPFNAYLQQAAAMCSGAAAQGKDMSTVVGMISGMLKGAQMPAACK
jgi:hypothetical protein